MEQSKCGKINGIILNLFKRKLFQNASDVPFYDDMLLGFYDGVVLTYPEKWLDFGPEGVDALLDNRNSEIFQKEQEYDAWEKFSGTYPVKLLFPRETCQKNMEKSYGFDFSSWKKDSKDQQPLFAALLLNVTDRFIVKTAKRIANESPDGKAEHRLSIVAQTIWEAIQSIKSEDTAQETVSKVGELHCGLFQCIGYYDYALLFRSNNWNMIYRIADQLKSWNIAPELELPEYFLSNHYLLLGMSNKSDAWKSIDPYATCEMSVQINLREGHSVEEFYHAFLYKVEKRDGHNSNSWRFWSDSTKVNFYQVNGGADCIIMTKSPGMGHVLREFAEGGLFTPVADEADSFFRRYIANITTSARRCLKNLYDKKQDDEQWNNKLLLKEHHNNNGSIQHQERSREQNVETKLLSWIREMRELSYWSQDSAFIRRAHGMQQLLAQYENLIGDNSAFDIRKVLQPAYKILYLNLTNLKRAWEKEYEQLNMKENFAKSYQIKGYMRKYQERIYRLLTDFREKVGGFQDALQLSDRHFIESVRINHPSVGSSTKLLLAYNQLLNQFVKEMGEKLKRMQEFDWIPCEYQFLLSCGGQDRAKAWNISEQIPSFNCDSKNCRNEEALIVMNMSERSIFDIRGTMLRMLHELWHYCGHRKRTLRCECIVVDASL